LLQTGAFPIATVMERLLTGYAGDFNRRHKRHGHLFQNRYKSILCQEEPYFLELVRYIHLNPIRARIVKSMQELKGYRYCGHAGVVGSTRNSWHLVDEVLLRFDQNLYSAVSKYETFVSDGVAAGKRPELTGGGLVRSAGGWQSLASKRRFGDYRKGDERILGDSDFVEEVLNSAEEVEEKNYYREKGLDLEWLVQLVANLLKLNAGELWQGGKKSLTVEGRDLVCFWATQEMGMTATSVGCRLKISQPTASRAAQRGQQLAAEKGWTLRDMI
jgi:hypothetical protein